MERMVSTLRPARWLFWALWDWSLIALALALAIKAHHLAVYLVAALVIGTRQHALAVLAHEGAHLLICRKRWLNEFLAEVFCFYPMGGSIRTYRDFHFKHHRSLGGREDPEMELKAIAKPQWDLPASGGSILTLVAKDLVGLGLRDAGLGFRSLMPKTGRDFLGLALFWGPVGAVLHHFRLLWVVAFWFATMSTVQWAIFRLRIWTEHMGTMGTQRIHASWWQRWFLFQHNAWYHYEHHHWPALAFYDLPRGRTQHPTVPVHTVGELLRAYSVFPSIPSGEPAPEMLHMPEAPERPRLPRMVGQSATS
jgi:fatty acid desaturase